LVSISSQINPVHAIQCYFCKIHFNIVLSRTYMSSYAIFSSGFPTKILYAFLFSTRVLHVLHVSSSLTSSMQLYFAKVQVINLLVMQVSPRSCYLIPLWSKQSSRHLIRTNFPAFYVTQKCIVMAKRVRLWSIILSQHNVAHNF
jgi:hypothetical protein